MEEPPRLPPAIPRTTCALFGALKVASTLRRTAVLVHGPRGCVYHVNYILGMRGDRHNPVYCTCMDEHDVVFGAEEKLKDAIRALDRAGNHDVIVVLSCCASGIIGEDLEAACRGAGARALVVPVEVNGFSGDFSTGYAATLAALIARTADGTVEKVGRSVNLVGMLRGGPDLSETKRLLAGTGIHVNAVLPAGATRDDLGNVCRAELNVVMCETSGLRAAQFMEEAFGIPWISATFPIGDELSRAFVRDVAGALGIPAKTADSTGCTPPRPVSAGERGPRVAICAGPTRAVALSLFLRARGIHPQVLVLDFPTPLLPRIRDAAGDSCEILVAQPWERIEEALASRGVDVIVGGLMEQSLARKIGARLVDVMHGSMKTVGREGGENILSRILSGPGRSPSPPGT
ncbi:MAG: nitrogenase component 1 [Methanolinea sp.]|nr:nitrogenase component 1 [Methanolinea sp.]